MAHASSVTPDPDPVIDFVAMTSKRNTRWHEVTAVLVTVLFLVVQCTIFMMVVPLAEKERVHDFEDNANSSLGTLQKALKDLGLEGETFYNNGTKMYCESIRFPKHDGGHEGRYEIYNTWSNMAFIVFGLIQWITVRQTDVMVLLMASAAMFMGAGSLAFHHYGYFAFWALDVLPMVMLMVVLLSALWTTIWRTDVRPWIHRGVALTTTLQGCPQPIEWVIKAAVYAFCKFLEIIPFVYLWIVLCLNVLFFIDRATVKAKDGTASIFLRNNPNIDPGDMRGVLQVGTADLIIYGAVPLAGVGVILMFVALGLTLKNGGRWRDTGKEPDTWVVYGLFARVFFWLIIAFSVWTPETKAMEDNNGQGCFKHPLDFHFSHYFWHFFAAIALHHAAVYVGFRRAELYQRDGMVHYFPLYWFEKRWPKFFAGENSDHNEPSNRFCGNPPCTGGCWVRTLKLCGFIILRGLLRLIPWTTWDELTPEDTEAVLRIHAAWVRLELMFEYSNEGNEPINMSHLHTANKYIGNLSFQGFNEPRLSFRLETLRKKFREASEGPDFDAWFLKHFPHVVEVLGSSDTPPQVIFASTNPVYGHVGQSSNV